MELRPGYKKTDGGIIPEDWDYRPISEYARLESGHTPSKKFATYWNGSIPWVSLHDTDLLDRNFIDDTSLKITELGLANSSARLLPAGTVVFSRTATVGKASIITQPMATSQDFANYICGPRLFNEYLGYLFRSMQPVWKGLMAGSTHNTIYMPAFERLRIVVPPVAEQRAIVEALSDVDGSIDAVSRIIAKKRDMRTGAMQQLLTGQTRVAGFSETWETKRLGDCLSEPPSYGINAAAVPFTDRLPRYVRITDITEDGRFSPSPLVCVRTSSKRYQLAPGDLVFARTGASTGKTYLYDPADGELVYAGFLIRVRPDPTKLVSKFLAGLTTTRHYWNWVKTMSMRSGQPGINGQEYSRFEFRLPSVEEQAAISQVLSDMDAEITALEARLEKTRALKQGMMQALLTGRVRLPVQDEALDALEVAHA